MDGCEGLRRNRSAGYLRLAYGGLAAGPRDRAAGGGRRGGWA